MKVMWWNEGVHVSYPSCYYCINTFLVFVSVVLTDCVSVLD